MHCIALFKFPTYAEPLESRKKSLSPNSLKKMKASGRTFLSSPFPVDTRIYTDSKPCSVSPHLPGQHPLSHVNTDPFQHALNSTSFFLYTQMVLPNQKTLWSSITLHFVLFEWLSLSPGYPLTTLSAPSQSHILLLFSRETNAQ